MAKARNLGLPDPLSRTLVLVCALRLGVCVLTSPFAKRTRTGADEDGGVDEAPQPSLQRTARLRKNQDLLRSLRSQHGARLRLRAERGPSPQELVKQASLAARLQDLDIIRLEAGIERREPAQWDELRVWDPGDG